MRNRASAVVAAFTGKKLIAKKIFTQKKVRVFLELRNGNEIWVRGQFQDWHWFDGPEFQITTLPEDVKNTLLKENPFSASKSLNFRQAIKLAWHEAAKQNRFFKCADIFQENHLLAKRVFNSGSNEMFLEIRDGLELWVYGRFYDTRWLRGPEVKIELELTPELHEELLLRESWTEPMTETVKGIVLQAWKQASEKHSFFEGAIA